MNAVVIERPGPPDVLNLTTLPIPSVKPGYLVVRVMAFGLNHTELHARQGLAGPSIVWPRVIGIFFNHSQDTGIECVGVVHESACSNFKSGDTVCALMSGMGRSYDGSYAEYTRVPESACHPMSKPESMSWKTLAALPEMFQTSNGSLTAGLGCVAGERILVRGGTSSIGMCSIVLAKKHGLEVYATTRSPEKQDLLIRYGADRVVIDTGDIHAKVQELGGVDKVLEIVGTRTIRDSMLCCRPGGTVCMVGCLDGWDLPAIPDLYQFIPSTVKMTVYGGGSGDVTSKELSEFVQMVSNGEISIAVDDGDYCLGDIVKVHEAMEAGKTRGKVVIVI